MGETVLNIGKNGDVINLLGYCYARRNDPVTLIVGWEHYDLLEGVSYVKRLKWSKGPESLQEAIPVCKRQFPNVRVGQVFMNSDSRHLTPSYAQESYRLIGAVDEWGTHPTIFDKRSPEREEALLAKHDNGKPLILVAVEGISSPYQKGPALIDLLRNSFPECNVVDMRDVKGERFYDLLGLMDKAKCLVTVDTAHLWLSRASVCPVVALTNDGWLGSPPPPQTMLHMPYSAANHQQIVARIRKLFKPVGKNILVVDDFGKEERHKQARKTWKPDLLVSRSDWGRNMDGLPFLKDMLKVALRCADTGDTIVWTNSDVQLREDAFAVLSEHCRKFGACSVRRVRKEPHIGRELFAFEASWLRNNLEAMPDGIISKPWFDLAMAAYIRKTKGIKTTMENLYWDFTGAEIVPGVAIHPDHPSEWTDKREHESSKHNERLFRELF